MTRSALLTRVAPVYTKDMTPMPQPSPLLVDHLAYCRARGLRDSTVTQRGRAVRRFIRRVGCDPLDATENQAIVWFASLTGTIGGRSVDLSHVRSYCRWAVRFGHRPVEATRLLDMPRRSRRLPRPIATDRLTVALDNAYDPRLRAILILGAYAGLRACEIARLDWRDVSDDAIVIRDGKGGHQRVVPMHSRVATALAGVPTMSGPVLPRHDGKPGHMTAMRVSGLANEHLHNLGIADTLHSLRHSFASRMYSVSLDIRVVQEALGHQSIGTTAGYVALDTTKARGYVAAL